ncbi:MAG TPA: type IV toxin-antitoxin system AbiEi family antitoxin domain-containing protein [Acidothermaceae bacterium]
MVQHAELPNDASGAPSLSLARPFTYADAIHAGYARGLIRYLIVTGRWLVLRRGVYCDVALAERAEPVWLHATAALLVMTAGSAISHETAGTLCELPVGKWHAGLPTAAPQSPMIYLTHPPSSRHARRGHPGVIERVAALPPSHLAYFQGILMTTAARTVLDLARVRPYAEGVAIADAALHLGITTTAQLVAVRDACRSWPGINRAAKVIEFADAATESPLESRSRVAFALGELPTPVLQAVVLLRNGRRARVDFLWAQWRVIGEADGRLKIQRPEDLWAEKLREDALRELGYEVVRWTWDEIVNRPEIVVARILRAAARARLRG